jgi:Ser/Thr protein kinase RdoA (MazF antagonist)
MTAFDDPEPLALPSAEMWSSIGVVCGLELHGGYQSKVFAAEHDGHPVVVKLTDGRLVDPAFQQRLEVVAAAAAIDDLVVGPIATSASLGRDLDEWRVVLYPMVSGTAPDVRVEEDVRRMASTLAELHRVLDRLGPFDVPGIAALAHSTDAAGMGRPQLLHGDYSHANVVFTRHGVRVFDFDDCGYGPVEFEVGNTLYMMLFDAAMSSRMQDYERFRDWFVSEYRSTAGRDVPDDLLDKSIDLRVDALRRWVERPETAPIGIRTATPAWRESLRAFVRSRTRT